MTKDEVLKTFCQEWAAFLQTRGHTVSAAHGCDNVLMSRDNSGTDYRWLLALAPGKSQPLGPVELDALRQQFGAARRLSQKAYLVLRFRKPLKKVVVLPVETALKRKRLLSRKGGIPWNPP